MPPKKQAVQAPPSNPFLAEAAAEGLPAFSAAAPAQIHAAMETLRASLAASVDSGFSAVDDANAARVGMEGIGRKAMKPKSKSAGKTQRPEDPAAPILQQFAELSDIVAAGERAARAEFACRRRFTLGLQRLATLPESETGYDGSKADQAAALQHLVKGGVAFEQCRSQLGDRGWVASATAAVLDGSVRVVTHFSRNPVACNNSCDGWWKVSPAAVPGPVFTEFGVRWHETRVKELSGDTVKKLLRKASPLQALSPKTLELVSRMSSCVLPALPDADEDSWVDIREGYRPGFGPLLPDVLFSGLDFAAGDA